MKQNKQINKENSFYKSSPRDGISLIVLVITIIVIIILAGAIILALSNNNPISAANQAVFKQDLGSFKAELEIYKSNEYVKGLGQYDSKKLYANATSITYDGQILSGNITDIIQGLKNKYQGEFEIIEGELWYVGIDTNKINWAKDSGVSYAAETPQVIIDMPDKDVVAIGTDVVYKINFTSNVGIKEVNLSGNIELIDNSNNVVVAQIDVGELQGSNTIKNITVTVKTSSLENTKEYRLRVKEGALKSQVDKVNSETISEKFTIDNDAPQSPNIDSTPKTATNQNVVVTITYPEDADKKEYSYDTQNWFDYVEPITITENKMIYARAIDKAGNQSGQANYEVTNIDKVLPQSAVVNITATSNVISGTITLADSESDIDLDKSKYILTASNTAYDKNNTIWNTAKAITSKTQNIQETLSSLDNCYIQVLSVDKAGNRRVDVSGMVLVAKVNAPAQVQGMTPVKWDTSNNESTTTVGDPLWYNYNAKQWANMKTTNNSNTAYWVWIPRYAYKIDHPHTTTAEQIHIIFLQGTSNIPVDGSTLPSDYIVHPAFTFGGTQLTGIWVAKYEASSSNSNVVESGIGYTGGGNTTSLQVRVLPSVYSWRNISVGNMQTVSMNMTTSTGSVGTTTNIDTHQMKNMEWGAVAYLSQSQYGEEPWINPYGDGTTGSWKMKTGYSGQSKDSATLAEGNIQLHPYNDLTYGVNSSTTHNIYGIYDISGGAWEIEAAILNNGTSYIGTNGGVTYTQSNKIRPEYTKYYDIYEPSDEEKEGGAYYGAAGTTLWNSGYTEAQNIIRKRITDGTYAKLVNSKGDALWEASNNSSYYGKFTDTGSYNWLISTSRAQSLGPQYTPGWNGDYMLIGHSLVAWFLRGGYFDSASGAGLFRSDVSIGDPYMVFSFRPVLIAGSGL